MDGGLAMPLGVEGRDEGVAGVGEANGGDRAGKPVSRDDNGFIMDEEVTIAERRLSASFVGELKGGCWFAPPQRPSKS